MTEIIVCGPLQEDLILLHVNNKGILLPQPLSNDPRYIQCIYCYSHASKRFVEVYRPEPKHQQYQKRILGECLLISSLPGRAGMGRRR